ncbi:MAG: VWA domain-containing protein, partial [Anaerolineae bacterium]
MSSVSSPTLRLHPLAPASLSRTGVLVVALLIGTGPGTSPPAGHAQGLESYRLAATWTDAGDPQRVVAAPSGDVYTVVGGGSGVERRSPGGVVLGLTAAAGVEELAVDDAGSLYATRDHRLVAKYAPSGALVWADRIRGYGPIPTPSGERAPYLTGVAWTPGTSEVTVAYDFGALDGGSEFRVRAYVRGGASRAAFSVQGATDTYGDAGAGSQGVYLLNRTRNQVERYTGGAYAGSTPLPEPIERIAIGPDGAVFALARHRWVYKVASNGSLTAVWDALDPTPDMGAESTATDLDVDAAGKVYVVDPTRRQVRVYEPDPDPAAVPPPPPAPPSLDCQIFPDKFAAPTRLRLGERTKVTLRLDGGCPEVSDQADIVLVVDVSGSMEGDKLAAARSAVQTFVGLMDLTQHQVGLVAFETTARVMVGLTTNPGAIVNAAQSLVALGGTDIAAGIDAALGELSGPNRRPRAKPIIVLMTDGKPTAVTGAAVVAASDRARYMRSPAACRGTMTCAVTLYAIGLGGDVDQDMLRIVATTPELYFYAPQPSELEAVYSLIARRIHATELMKFVRIVDQVPGNMTYV